ncbi:DNA mismatch repair endonuclease MutL [Psychrobacter sp. HD31]|uniref:DNA mismatch repair endonuclease MutL n=1 Tax=Psychrobacter sp. HD31 TaxID=3112003 RepID=UPI003DA42CC8
MSIATSRIQKLSPLLINQLAAGEVVTRPASVVKEVLENAIDAAATQIEIRITQGGMGIIEISDNGVGIHPDDMQMAVTRHATSKVADVESLYGINTLGFRGEALASIAAVSRLSLTSSHDDSGVGRCLNVAGVIDGKVDIVPCVCQRGTTVTVKDLYFNVPARRGNLKNVATEYAHIESVIRQIALAYADIDLTLYHEGKKRLTLSAQADKSSKAQHNRLQQALAIGLPKNGYPLAIDLSGLLNNSVQSQLVKPKIDGWIWLDDNLQPNTDLPKLIYINGRLVKNVSISQQVRQAVNSLDIGFQTVGYALFFTLPNEWCNLNVHPSKQRINIHALTNINAYLYQAIRALLQPNIAAIKKSANSLSTSIEELKVSQNNESSSDKLDVDDVNYATSANLVNSGLDKTTHAVHSPSETYQVGDVADLACDDKLEQIELALDFISEARYETLLNQFLTLDNNKWYNLKDDVLSKDDSVDIQISNSIDIMSIKVPEDTEVSGHLSGGSVSEWALIILIDKKTLQIAHATYKVSR